MELKGVVPIGGIRVTKSGKKSFSFITPYSKKVVSSIGKTNYKTYLKSINKSSTQMILDINNIDFHDLPLCNKCYSNPVRIVGLTRESMGPNILNPVLDIACSSKCSMSLRASRVSKLTLEKGVHPSQTISKKDWSRIMKKASKTSFERGTHRYFKSKGKELQKVQISYKEWKNSTNSRW